MKDVFVTGSNYTADVSGVCSALYELGGMVVIHDPSGCNSTYNTHDEPRWYDQESLIYISGLSQMDAVMGNDDKFIGDVVRAARQLKPEFIVLIRSPIPLMIGTDFDSIASLIEEEVHIPVYFIPTTGMSSYIYGAGEAFLLTAEKLLKDLPAPAGTERPSLALLGATPLDLSVTGSLESIRKDIEKNGFDLAGCMAMDTDLNKLSGIRYADVSLVLSGTGLPAARFLEAEYGIPFVTGMPVEGFASRVYDALGAAIRTGKSQPAFTISDQEDADSYIIGEAVISLSISEAVRIFTGRTCRVICPLFEEREYGIEGVSYLRDEEEIMEAVKDAEYVIADPLYEPLLSDKTRLIRLPHEAYSGRCFRKEIPDLTTIFQSLLSGRI